MYEETSPRQEATPLIGKQATNYPENFLRLINHPQCEAILLYKPQLVGEHR